MAFAYLWCTTSSRQRHFRAQAESAENQGAPSLLSCNGISLLITTKEGEDQCGTMEGFFLSSAALAGASFPAQGPHCLH